MPYLSLEKNMSVIKCCKNVPKSSQDLHCCDISLLHRESQPNVVTVACKKEQKMTLCHIFSAVLTNFSGGEAEGFQGLFRPNSFVLIQRQERDAKTRFSFRLINCNIATAKT